jgi:ribonuclease D
MRWIDRPEQLASFCQGSVAAGPLAIDMEFERERTYRAILQLVQLATPSEQVLVDPLALGDLSPLWDRIADPKQLTLFHAGGQDMEIMFDRSGGRTPRHVFDTQIAAAMLGMGEQPGYADLVRRVLDVKLKKGERTTDWGKRPLSPAQVEYAIDDVRHLHALHANLWKRLQTQERADWLGEELEFYEHVSTYRRDPRSLWLRVSRHRSLDRRGLAILRELAIWREEAASRRDIPRNRVAADDVLIDLTRRKPQKPEDLAALRRLHPKEIERSAEALLTAVRRGVQCPDTELPRLPELRDDDSELNLIADLMAVFVKFKAREAKIAASYLGTKKDIVDLAYAASEGEIAATEIRLLQGWRRRLVGDELLLLLAGKLTLAADPKEHRLRAVRESSS